MIATGYLQVILICTSMAALVFAGQFVLCRKVQKPILRFLPLFAIGAVYLTAGLCFLSELLGTQGGVAIGVIFAFLLLVIGTIMLAADLLAWLLAFLIRK